jgi:hypothetical protein
MEDSNSLLLWTREHVSANSTFKLQCTTEWGDNNFRDLWGMITHALQARYPNLLILVDLAHVQCVSRATCEHAFSKQNLIKTKVGNMLGNKNLETMLRIALERLDEEVDDIIDDVVPLWKNDSNYRFCMLIPLLIRILQRHRVRVMCLVHLGQLILTTMVRKFCVSQY